jgi:hypothetical protein
MNMEMKHIYVTGDVAMDTNIYKGIRKSPEEMKYGTLIKKTEGGSNLLSEIISRTLLKRISCIDALIKKSEQERERVKDKKQVKKLDIEIQKLSGKRAEILELESKYPIQCKFGLIKEIFTRKSFPSQLETYAVWDLKETVVPKTYQKICGDKFNAWKVTEMMGWGQQKSEGITDVPFAYSNYIFQVNQNPDILVFDDGGNNFRNDKKAWRDLLYENSEDEKKKNPRNIAQIILKTAFPPGHGKLFGNLTREFANKLTIITSINELRREDVLISKGISWEQTALDLVSELKYNKSISSLLNCKRLIVTFQSEGAIYFEMDDKMEIKKCRLIFDPEHLEGEWLNAGKIYGDVFGLMSCFTAAVTYGLQAAFIKACFSNKKIDDKINMESLITSGLSAMRRYKIVGHGKDESNPEFPFESICSEIIVPASQFASAFVPVPAENKRAADYLKQNWTILEGNYKSSGSYKPIPLFDTAFRYALFGDNELVNTPFFKINYLTTYDRREIEALRNFRNLISDYIPSLTVHGLMTL